MQIPSIAQATNLLSRVLGFGYWAIVDSETQNNIATFDTFYDFSFTQDSNITTYPIENGDFVSYNKQNNPYTINVTLIKSGLTIPYLKKQFVSNLSVYVNTAKLVDVITPQGAYLQNSLSNLSYVSDPEDNSDMIIARVTIKEVKYLGSKIGSANNNLMNRLKQGLKSAVAL